MKTCSRCGESKVLDEFNKNKSKPDGLSHHCKDCRKYYNVKYYEGTKVKYKPSRDAARNACKKRNRDWLKQYLQIHSCVDCGNTDIRVLEFDHRGDDKVCDVSRLMASGLDKLKAEVLKCDVRCKNCHAIKTYERLGNVWRTI